MESGTTRSCPGIQKFDRLFLRSSLSGGGDRVAAGLSRRGAEARLDRRPDRLPGRRAGPASRTPNARQEAGLWIASTRVEKFEPLDVSRNGVSGVG